MRIYMETDLGSKIEIKEITSINPDSKLLIFLLNRHLSYEDVEEIKKRLETATNINCLVLGAEFKEQIYGI